MSIQANFPNVQPSLLLDFANAKQLPPSVNFTRATTATYYDGSTTALAEQNLVTQSQAFNVWGLENIAVSADATTAPDGTTTADTITATGPNANHSSYAPNTISVTAGLVYTFSVYAKKNGSNFVQLTWYPGQFGNAYANFDLNAGTAGTASGCTSTITNVGNGWYRCTMTATCASSGTSYAYYCIVTSSTAGIFEAFAPTTQSIYLWGYQLEQRSTATAYTATTTQPITNYIPVLLTAGGGQPRFDHNPTTSVSLGLAIESQRTNVAIYSSDFANPNWTQYNGGVITSNQMVAPDGTVTADQMVMTSTQYSGVYQSGPAGATGTCTISVWARTATGTQTFNIGFYNGIQGAVMSSNLTATTSWQRFTFTATLSGVSNIHINNYTASAGTIYIWGVQVEQGSFATSYIPTTSAAATRAAETVTMSTADTAAILDIAQGVMLVEATLPPTGGYDIGTFACGIGYSSTDYLGLLYAGTGYFQPTHGGFGPTPNAEVGGTLNKGAMSWSGTSGTVPAAYAQNGQVSNTGNGNGGLTCFAKFPNLTYLSIGYAAFDTALANRKQCWIGKVAVYPQAATSAQLQALTA